MTRAPHPAFHFFQRSALWAALSLSIFGSAHALTLSPPVVLSKQGEALLAEADITEASLAEQVALKASIASPELYQAAKVPLPNNNGTPLTLEVQLLQRSNGRPYLKITSRQPIAGNALDVLIDLRWADGRLLRDFNLLIEDAARTQKPVAPIVVAGDSKRSTDAQPINVQRGDTASEIAVQRMPSGVSLDQMLLAMLRNNPDAFVDNNVNRLKAGALVSMPSAEQAQQVSRADARKEMVVQTQNFEAYRAELAARAPGGSTPKATRDSAGKLQAQVQSKQDKASQDKLTLTKPNNKGEQEEKIAREREAIEAANKAEALTRNIEELGKIAAATAAASDAGVLSVVTPPPADAASAADTHWLDTLTQHPLAPVGAGGLIALLVLVGLWARRSRPGTPAEDDGIQGLPPLNVKFDLNLPHGDDFDGRSPEGAATNTAEHALETPHDAPSHDHPEHSEPEHEQAHEHAPDEHHEAHENATDQAHHAPQATRPTLEIPNANHDETPEEHPYQVRMDLAEELWKLGQLHTSRALMEEVANEASGDIQAQARQWLAERG